MNRIANVLISYSFRNSNPKNEYVYRFGFNGKELDKEGMGGGASTYDYGFRIYNSALAKFLSVDPLHKDYPWYTPYQFAGNKPIWAIDLDGLEEFIRTDYFNSVGQIYRTEIQVTKKDKIDGQIVHQCNVVVDDFGNAVINEVGTQFGNTLPGGAGSNLFNAVENATIWNVVPGIRNTTPPAPPVMPIGTPNGSTYTVTHPDMETGNIVVCQAFAPGGGLAGPGGAVAGGTEFSCVPLSNNVNDPDYNGMYVFNPPGVAPPRIEPYMPAGFNNVTATPSQRIHTPTGQTFAAGLANGTLQNGGGSVLFNEASTPTSCVLSGDNRSTTSDFPGVQVINVPTKIRVGNGNPSAPANRPCTITIN